MQGRIWITRGKKSTANRSRSITTVALSAKMKVMQTSALHRTFAIDLCGVMPLHCLYQEGTKDYADIHAGAAEGRELSPIIGAPFGMDADEWSEE